MRGSLFPAQPLGQVDTGKEQENRDGGYDDCGWLLQPCKGLEDPDPDCGKNQPEPQDSELPDAILAHVPPELDDHVPELPPVDDARGDEQRSENHGEKRPVHSSLLLMCRLPNCNWDNYSILASKVNVIG